jgi:hypothetical protein
MENQKHIPDHQDLTPLDNYVFKLIDKVNERLRIKYGIKKKHVICEKVYYASGHYKETKATE